MQTYSEEDQMCLYDPGLWCGKTSPEPSPAGNRRGKISGLSSRKLFELSSIPYQFLDLTPGAGKKAGCILLGDSFSLAWRVLDAQYWGVPQRRRRIYLVADFGGQTAPKILFNQESLPRDFTPILRTGQAPADSFAERP